MVFRAKCIGSVREASFAAYRVTGVRTFSSSITRNKQNLVILGSGWGGYEVLRGVDKKRWSESAFITGTIPEV